MSVNTLIVLLGLMILRLNVNAFVQDSIILSGVTYLDENLNSTFDLEDVELKNIPIEIYEDVNQNYQVDLFDLKIAETTTNIYGEYTISVNKYDYLESTYKINSSSDDAVQNEPGGQMVLDGYAASGIREIGLRFNEIDIPQAASIESASLKITMANGSEDFIEIIVKGELSNNASTFTNEDYNIFTRPRTNAVIEWHSYEPREMFQEIEIDGIKEVIQEIVNQPGWRNGNSLVLIIADFDSDMLMFDAGYPAELIIKYKDDEPNNTSYIISPKVENIPSEYEMFDKPFVFYKSHSQDNHWVNFGFIDKSKENTNPVSNIDQNQDINVWPNPTIGPINISLNTITENNSFKLKVFTPDGKLIKYSELDFTSTGEALYDLSDLSKGTYLLAFYDNTANKFVKKLILQ